VAAKFEISSPKPGEFRWVLNSQGRILARSESYTRKGSCEKAIESLRKAVATATVADLTAPPAKAAPAAAKKVAKKAAKAPAAEKATKTAGKAAAPAAEKKAPRKRAARAG
jgi:uncharacterized protein YegP (UPF0339 family)